MPAVPYKAAPAPATADGPLRPHPLLSEYHADEASRLRQVRRWFDLSACDYDWVNAFMSMGSGQRYRSEALQRLGVAPGQRLLDAGAGTGTIAAIAQSMVGGQGIVAALDPSLGMLAQAGARGVRNLVPGRAEQLPFADASFDRLTMGYALRHVADLDATFREYARVLAPGGRLLLLEITRPRQRLGLHLLRFYMRTVVPQVTRWLRHGADTATLMRYYWDTIEHCVAPEAIMGSLRAAGFEPVQRRVQFGVLSEYTAVKPVKNL